MQREVLQITHHCNKQKDCSSFSLGEKKENILSRIPSCTPPPDHPLWSISIVIGGSSSEYMTSQSSPALCGFSHPNPLERICIIHHILETTRVCLQMQQQEKRKRKKNNWNCPTTLMEKIKFNTKNKSLQSLKRMLRYFHSVWHRGQNEQSWRESEKKQTRANTKHHFSGTQYTGRICWGQQTGVVNETESNLGQKLVCLSDFLV